MLENTTDMKKRCGWCGMVNDHVADCFRYQEIAGGSPTTGYPKELIVEATP